MSPKAKSDLSKTDVPKLQPEDTWTMMLKPGYLIGGDKTVRIRKLYRGPDHDRNKDQPLRWYAVLGDGGLPSIMNKDVIHWSADGETKGKGGRIDQTHYVDTNAEGNITEFIFKFDDGLTY
jgi:hypothetical protein